MSYTYYTNSKNLSAKINFNEKLILPCNKPNIHCIKDVNVNVDIIGTKVISTPLNKIVDKKNLNLAKERLLIAGWICIKICYLSSPDNKCLSNVFFKLPFNVHIPLNKSISCCTDIFSITFNTKNISSKPCDCRNIMQKLTLFLFAKKTGSIAPEPPPIPPIQKLPNAIIVKDNSNESEVAKIEFNSTDKKIIVTSYDVIPDSSAEEINYFSLILKDKEEKVKTRATILTNRTASNFKATLNDFTFQYDDIIELQSLIPPTTTVTNFPIKGEDFIPNTPIISFVITPDSLENYVPPPLPPIPIETKLPNTILINNDDNILVAKIEFDSTNKSFIITSTDENTNASTSTLPYFSLDLIDMVTSKVKANSSINSNSNANTFMNDLNGTVFEYFDILDLGYLSPQNITITNYPNYGDTHVPTLLNEKFNITSNGLTEYIPPTPPPPPSANKLPNAIIIENNNKTTISPVATIEFDTDSKKLIVTSSGLISDNTSTPSTYFSLKLINTTSGSEEASSIILSNENANTFASDLSGEPFEYGYILELTYLIPSNIVITNYPNAQQNYIPNIAKEYYQITPEGLEPYSVPTPPPPIQKLPNAIIVKSHSSDDSSPVVIIEFNSDLQQFIVNSTSIIPDSKSASSIYFSLKLKDSNNENIKASSTILSDENADNFAKTLNTTQFQYDDILELDYLIPSNIIITNFPTITQIHTPTSEKEYYRITLQGLEIYK